MCRFYSQICLLNLFESDVHYIYLKPVGAVEISYIKTTLNIELKTIDGEEVKDQENVDRRGRYR